MPRNETFRPEHGGVGDTGGEQAIYEAEDAVDKPKSTTWDMVDVVTEATWNEALARLGRTPSDPLPLWTMLASRILRAVAIGERDPERLTRLALEGLRSRDWFADER